jgi:hypothetical protein
VFIDAVVLENDKTVPVFNVAVVEDDKTKVLEVIFVM